MIITCPECGQALMNEDNRALTDAEAAELALQTCECPAARAWRSKEKQIDEACFNIESLCVANARELGMTEIENDEVIDILKKTARLIADAKVFDLTVTTVGHGKVKISKSGKNSISVKRTVGHTEELKANEKILRRIIREKEI